MTISQLMDTPLRVGNDPVWRLALRMWRERQEGWPRFIRRDPDEFDLVSGAWALALEAARERMETDMTKLPVDPIVEAVRTDLLRRSQVGIAKYGVTLERTDLDLRGWAQHAYEELLDGANYLKRVIVEIDGGLPDEGAVAEQDAIVVADAARRVAYAEERLQEHVNETQRLSAMLYDLGVDPNKGGPRVGAFTHKDKADCAGREARMRKQVYPRRIATGTMLAAEADRQVAIMEEIAADYQARVQARQPGLFDGGKADG